MENWSRYVPTMCWHRACHLNPFDRKMCCTICFGRASPGSPSQCTVCHRKGFTDLRNIDLTVTKDCHPCAKILRNRRCCLVVLGIEVGGRWSNEESSFVRMLAQARASHPCAQPPHLLWCPAGLLSLLMQQPFPSLPAFCLKIFPPTTTWTEIFHPSVNSSPTPAQLCRPVVSQPGSGWPV